MILQKQLAHTNLQTTGFYLQFDQKDRVEILNKVFRKKDKQNDTNM